MEEGQLFRMLFTFEPEEEQELDVEEGEVVALVGSYDVGEPWTKVRIVEGADRDSGDGRRMEGYVPTKFLERVDSSSSAQAKMGKTPASAMKDNEEKESQEEPSLFPNFGDESLVAAGGIPKSGSKSASARVATTATTTTPSFGREKGGSTSFQEGKPIQLPGMMDGGKSLQSAIKPNTSKTPATSSNEPLSFPSSTPSTRQKTKDSFLKEPLSSTFESSVASDPIKGAPPPATSSFSAARPSTTSNSLMTAGGSPTKSFLGKSNQSMPNSVIDNIGPHDEFAHIFSRHDRTFQQVMHDRESQSDALLNVSTDISNRLVTVKEKANEVTKGLMEINQLIEDQRKLWKEKLNQDKAQMYSASLSQKRDPNLI